MAALAALKGGCFVAGTQVVLAVAPEPTFVATAADPLEVDNQEFANASLLVGIGLTLSSLVAPRRKKAQSESAHELVFAEAWEKEQKREPRRSKPRPEDIDDINDFDEFSWDWQDSEEWNELLTMTAMQRGSDELSQPVALLDPPRTAAPEVPAKVEPIRQPRTNAVRQPQEAGSEFSWIRRAALVTGLALLLTSGWTFLLGSPPASEASSTAATTLASLQTAPATQSIETIRLGQWVKAHNPELSDEERPAGLDTYDPASLRVVSLRMLKEDGTPLDMQFLRTDTWLEEHQIVVGGKLNVEVAEIGASGLADVLAIEDAPPIEPRPSHDARLVTGRYAHAVSTAYNLEIVDDTGEVQETIGVTDNHPFWSADRQEFVPAGELSPGETLLDFEGNLHYVGTITPRAGPEPVYNLEVDVEHVYYISDHGFLVHNAGCGTQNWRQRLPKSNGRWTRGKPGDGYWKSTLKAINNVTKNRSIRFKNGRPDFSPWAKGKLTFKKGQLTGRKKDFDLVHEKLKEDLGLPSKAAAKRWLEQNKLTAHHKDATTIELVPSDLHNNLPHIGSASDIRGGY